MRHSTPAVLVLATLLGCSGNAATGASGSYQLETDGFAESMADIFIEQGKVPADARPQAIAALEGATMDVDLATDGTFTFSQKIAGDKHVYTGTWTETGSAVTLNQTHDNGEEIEDEMSGTLDGDALRMTYTSEGHTLKFLLRRKGAAAAPGR